MYQTTSIHRFRLSQIIRCVCVLFILLEQNGICQTKEPVYKKYSTLVEPLNHPVVKLMKEWSNLTATREFTDTTKQFKVRARIMDFTQESVTIRISGQSDLTIVPLEKLDPSHSKEVARLIVLEKQIPSALAKYKEIHAELKKNSVIFGGLSGFFDGLEIEKEAKKIKIPVKDIVQLNEIPNKITPEHAEKMVIIEVLYKDLTGDQDTTRTHFSLEQSLPSKMKNGKYITWRLFEDSSESSTYYDSWDDRDAHKPTKKWGLYTRRLLMSRTLDVGKTITFLETRGDDIPQLRKKFDFEKLEEQAAQYQDADMMGSLSIDPFSGSSYQPVLAYSDRTDTFVHNGFAYEVSMPKELFFNGRRQQDYGLKLKYAATGKKGMDINEAMKKLLKEKGPEAAKKAMDDLAFKKTPIPGTGDGAKSPSPIRVFFHAYVGKPVKQRLVIHPSRHTDMQFKKDEVSLINYDWLHFDNQFDSRSLDLGLGSRGMWDVSLSKQRPKLSVGENVFNLTPPPSSSKKIKEKLLKEEERTPEGIDVLKRYEAKRELCGKVGAYTINAGEIDQDVEVIRLYIQKWSAPLYNQPTDGHWVISDDKTISLDLK